jgi:hypothetical protein
MRCKRSVSHVLGVGNSSNENSAWVSAGYIAFF